MTARRHALAAAFLGLATAGCAANAPAPAPAAAGAPKAPAVVVRDDLSPRYIEFIGPKILFAKPFLDVPDTNYFALRSWLDRKTGAVEHQLYVSESYVGARRMWLGARDGEGDALPVVAISSHEIACQPSCSYADEFAATLPDALLRKSLGGLAVTFSAKGGSVKTIVVPGAVVKAELETVDAWRRRLEQVKTARAQSSR
jgi:hypothetical protein